MANQYPIQEMPQTDVLASFDYARDEFPKYKVAAVQSAAVYMNSEATCDKAVRFIEEAAKNGCKLINFAECYIAGFCTWQWTHPSLDNVKYRTRAIQNAVTIDGPIVARLARAAKENDIYVIIGVNENYQGNLFISQLYFNPQGDLMGVHRKLNPTCAERTIWGQGDGSQLHVFKTELGNIGGLCCWEHFIPANGVAMNALGEELHCAAWPTFFHSGNFTWTDTTGGYTASQYYAAANACYVLQSCTYATADACDWYDMPNDSEEYASLTEWGAGACAIWGPDGSRLTPEVPEKGEYLVYADIDIAKVHDARAFLHSSGHGANKSLRIEVDRYSQDAVRFVGSPDMDTSRTYEQIMQQAND